MTMGSGTESVSGCPAVLLRVGDGVAVAARPIPEGTVLDWGSGGSTVAREPIRLGHKVATRDAAAGEAIRKYGQIIGFATRAIRAGEWVHTHNLESRDFQREARRGAGASSSSAGGLFEGEATPRTFRGFARADGRVGTRNYVAVISTVNCSASVSRMVSDRFRDGAWRRDFPNVDGVFAITHKGGCGLPYQGPDHELLERVLAGFATHPNVGAYVIIGLGCEVAQASHLVESRELSLRFAGDGVGGWRDGGRPGVIQIQEAGGIARTVEAGVEAVVRLLGAANASRRTEQPASKLVMAMECGGSDGNSGVTANPALGVAADLLVAQGGTAMLGETPEIYGAEHLLIERAATEEVGARLLERVRWWERHVAMFGAEINNNPSPGNKEGGLTTIQEKSLGALAKAGRTALRDVIGYAERPRTSGLVFMDTPGYDPVCTTGLVAGGANLLVFTTGRGSVLGLRPTPCVKVSTNTPMYERMREDMDLDAGTVLSGESVDSAGRRIFELALEVASGAATRSEASGVGEEEFAPWQIGPTL